MTVIQMKECLVYIDRCAKQNNYTQRKQTRQEFLGMPTTSKEQASFFEACYAEDSEVYLHQCLRKMALAPNPKRLEQIIGVICGDPRLSDNYFKYVVENGRLIELARNWVGSTPAEPGKRPYSSFRAGKKASKWGQHEKAK